jgi:hypothetical protein
MKTPPLAFTKGTPYLLDGQNVMVDGVDTATGKLKLKRPNTNEELQYELQDLMRMRMEGRLTNPPGGRASYEPRGKASLKALNDQQRLRVRRRMAYATACAPLYPVGPLSSRLANTINDVARRVGDKRPPSPHSVYRWMRRYILSNYDTAVFVQDAGAIRQRKSRIGSKEREFLAEEIERLLGSNIGATLNGVMDEALASVAKRLGYLSFIAKDGVEHIPDEFLIRAAERRAQQQQEQQHAAA